MSNNRWEDTMNNNNISPVNTQVSQTINPCETQAVPPAPVLPVVNPYQVPPVAPKKPKRHNKAKKYTLFS